MSFYVKKIFWYIFYFQTITYLDDKEQPSHITESAMSWTHGTVISGKKQDSVLTNPDMRISLSSTKKVKSYIDLYNKSLPPNVGGINAVSV